MSNMTLPEAAVYLNSTAYQVKKLIGQRKILDIGTNGNGKTRHKAIIPKESLDAYLSKIGGKRVEGKSTPESFMARLSRIESKLDRLINMWS